MSDTDNAVYLRGYRAGRKQGGDMTKGEFYDAAFLAALSGLTSRAVSAAPAEIAKKAGEIATAATCERGNRRHQ